MKAFTCARCFARAPKDQFTLSSSLDKTLTGSPLPDPLSSSQPRTTLSTTHLSTALLSPRATYFLQNPPIDSALSPRATYTLHNPPIESALSPRATCSLHFKFQRRP